MDLEGPGGFQKLGGHLWDQFPPRFVQIRLNLTELWPKYKKMSRVKKSRLLKFERTKNQQKRTKSYIKLYKNYINTIKNYIKTI